MADIVATNESVEGEGEMKQQNKTSTHIDDHLFENMSWRSSLSSGNPLNVDHCIDGNRLGDASIHQLCENVQDMQSCSSDRDSQWRQSVGSYGKESLIDFELWQLTQGEADEIEVIEEEEDTKNEVDVFPLEKEDNRSGEPDMETFQDNGSNLRKARKQDGKGRKKLYGNTGKEPNMRNGRKEPSDSELQNLELGRSLLEQAKEFMISSSDSYNPKKALQLSLEAKKLFERYADGKPDLELVMCLHITASMYERMGQQSEALAVLKRAIEIPVVEEGEKHALAKFVGLMQLGDTYAMLGQFENSISYYMKGLEIQKMVLGENDARVGETCRYVAEAYAQGLQLNKAEGLCKTAIEIHKESNDGSFASSLDEAANLSLMGFICEKKGDHEAALENLVLASKTIAGNGQELEAAFNDRDVGDTYMSLSRYDEAFSAYVKSLEGFKTIKGDNHPVVGSIYVRLADLFNQIGKESQARSYFQNALEVFENPISGSPPEEIARGFTSLSSVREFMDELEPAITLLHKALEIYKNNPHHQNPISEIEARIGVMYYMLEKDTESYKFLQNVVSTLRATKKNESNLLGKALNQMGLVCLNLENINEAAELFREARSVMEREFGVDHDDTLGVSSNLAAAYDAMGRLDEAINILEHVVATGEEKHVTANPQAEEEKRRLGELLKHAACAQGVQA